MVWEENSQSRFQIGVRKQDQWLAGTGLDSAKLCAVFGWNRFVVGSILNRFATYVQSSEVSTPCFL
jgi:hypothetical protein